MADFRPSPLTTTKNHPPQAMQFACYKDAEGDLYQCIIHQVDISKDGVQPGHSADGRYYNVSVTILYPTPSTIHPGKTAREGHAFDTQTNLVLVDGCGPGWPG